MRKLLIRLSRRYLILLLGALNLGVFLPAAEEPAVVTKAAADSSLEIYTVSELLNRAEAIVVAELGAADETGTRLNILEVIKAPPETGARLPDAKAFERAADLLNQETVRNEKDKKGAKPAAAPVKSAAPSAPAAPLSIAIVAGGSVPLPRPGTQALFILWDRDKAIPAAGAPIRYRLSHPQGLYGADLAPVVKLALSKFTAADRTRYLREWDERAAKRQASRKGDEDLKKHPAGNQESGLRLIATRPKRSIRDDNTFDVSVRFENGRGYDQAVYDGPVNFFGVRLRKKDASAEKSIILHGTFKQLAEGLDPGTLAIVDTTDFSTVAKGGTFSKELHFDAREHPILVALDGEYVLNVFYVSNKDGKGLEDLPAAPWTGTLISNDAALTFKAPASAAPPAQTSRNP